MTIHDITRLIVLLAGKSTAQEFSWAVFLFCHRKLRPMTQKRSAGMRTRRKGRWVPKQPRLGARMCHGTFFFKMAKTLSARRGICKKSVWIGKMQGIF